jgi:hypothetical protein
MVMDVGATMNICVLAKGKNEFIHIMNVSAYFSLLFLLWDVCVCNHEYYAYTNGMEWNEGKICFVYCGYDAINER